MDTEETRDGRSGPGEVHITIVVVPGRVRAALTGFLAGARVRAGLASGGLIAAVAAGAIIAVAAGAIIAVSASGGHGGRPLESAALATQFGIRLNCARLTAVCLAAPTRGSISIMPVHAGRSAAK